MTETLMGLKSQPAAGRAGYKDGFSSSCLTGNRRRDVRRLFLALAVLTGILVGYNFVIARSARHSQRRQLLARLDQIPPDTDVLFLGNSLVEAGCDMGAFREAWESSSTPPKAINIALGATTPVEQLLILERALQHPLRLRYFIYGFFDDQLCAPIRGEWSDLVGNRAFSYYFPEAAAKFYAPHSTFFSWELRLTHWVPMLSERSSLWGKVELLRRHFDEIGMPKHKQNRFGRVEDFAALEPRDIASFNSRCDAIVKGQAGFSPPIRQILELAHQTGAQRILLEMPMPARHRRIFYSTGAWRQLQGRLQSLAAQEHALYLCANDWVQDEQDFEDATHLSEAGAKKFSRQLATALCGVESGRTLVNRESHSMEFLAGRNRGAAR